MPHNQYNNDLPVPPPGVKDWRAAYASALSWLAGHYDGDCPPSDFMVQLVSPVEKWDRLDIAGIKVPYWKLAHYAAREQAEYAAANPPLSINELMELRCSMLGKPSEKVLNWLESKIREAIEEE